MYYALEVIKQEYADGQIAKELLEKKQLHKLSMEYLRDKKEPPTHNTVGRRFLSDKSFNQVYQLLLSQILYLLHSILLQVCRE